MKNVKVKLVEKKVGGGANTKKNKFRNELILISAFGRREFIF